MSERGKLQISTETQGFQAKAADPRWSIWVSANAGSGKTFVLTRRVLRLLLTEVAPQSILCLTYTKAAAAEMRRRVAGELARWAVADDATLEKELRAIEGHAFDRKLLKIARTLFAKALETPGGLKIVTIHAFCESVLHRFPLEAGVPFDFKVIEEDERSAMLLAAREAVIAQGLSGTGPAEAALTLFDLLSDFQISEAIALAMADGRKLKAVLADTNAAKANLRRLVGDSIGNVRDLQARFVGDTLLSPLDIREIVQLLDGMPTGKTRIADLLARLDPDQLDPSGWRAVFFTTTGSPRTLLAAKDRAKYPHIQERLESEQARLVALDAALGKARLIERSEALLDIVVAIVARYEHHKRARSLLDFDDLVELLGDLLANRALGPWVQYKLDAAIDHILVDESQDTNPEQWRVVRAIADEFFAGKGAVDRPRSLFAVGDQKQSIYSFQGAEPSLFGETGELFERRAADAELAFRRLPLRTSFRTLPEILKAVDLVSDQPGIQDALLETEKVHHDTARTMVGGSVTLWPPVQQAASVSESTDWPTEPATGGDRTAPRQVAERIAQEIRHWIDHKRPLTGRNRAVIADDVLILVQSRGPLFQEIIRALRQYNLPTPGADQLQVTRHDPAGVLVRARLQGQQVVVHAQMDRLVPLHVAGRRVVARHDDLHALQAHDAEGLRPAAVVADAHADGRVRGLPNGKSQVSHRKVLLFQMLQRRAVDGLRIARDMNLAVFADDVAIAADQDARVVLHALRKFGIAQIEADPLIARRIEERTSQGARHFGFEECLHLRRIVDGPAREERGQRQFRKRHPGRAPAVGVLQQIDQPAHDLDACVAALDGAELRDGKVQLAGVHAALRARTRPACWPVKAWSSQTGAPLT